MHPAGLGCRFFPELSAAARSQDPNPPACGQPPSTQALPLGPLCCKEAFKQEVIPGTQQNDHSPLWCPGTWPPLRSLQAGETSRGFPSSLWVPSRHPVAPRLSPTASQPHVALRRACLAPSVPCEQKLINAKQSVKALQSSGKQGTSKLRVSSVVTLQDTGSAVLAGAQPRLAREAPASRRQGDPAVAPPTPLPPALKLEQVLLGWRERTGGSDWNPKQFSWVPLIAATSRSLAGTL